MDKVTTQQKVYVLDFAMCDYQQGSLFDHTIWDGLAAFSTLEKAQAAAEKEINDDAADKPISVVWHEFNKGEGHVAEYVRRLFSKLDWSAARIYEVQIDIHEVKE